METTEKNLIENLLNLALKSGADEAEVIVAKGQGQSAELISHEAQAQPLS